MLRLLGERGDPPEGKGRRMTDGVAFPHRWERSAPNPRYVAPRYICARCGRGPYTYLQREGQIAQECSARITLSTLVGVVGRM